MSRTPMKLILTQEVSGLGAPGDVVDVAAGYGRNYLIPRGFAMNWTRGAEKQIELIQRARAAREIRGVEDAKVVAAQLEGLQVRMRRRAGASGRLFGSVGPADIATAVREARRPGTRPPPDRGPRPDQDRGLAPGPGQAAPRSQRPGRDRDHGQLVPPWRGLCAPGPVYRACVPLPLPIGANVQRPTPGSSRLDVPSCPAGPAVPMPQGGLMRRPGTTRVSGRSAAGIGVSGR